MSLFEQDPLSALEAITAAQRLAFAPLAFHATAVMRDRGVLLALSKAAPDGLAIDEVAATSGLSVYAARVLLEAGLGLHLVWRQEDRFHLGKVGYFLLNDEMTRVNFDFSRDVCYGAAAHLDASLAEGRPAGLQELGPWATLYEGLSVLPEPARRSWFAFDHFYSDQAFPAVCARLAAEPPASLLDVGCNTGRFARLCLERLPRVRGRPGRPADPARHRPRASAGSGGSRSPPAGIRSTCSIPELPLPGGYELIWMSQLLDCFSEAQIVAVLSKVRAALPPGGRLWILELFWDRQRFEAAAFSLQQTSLYFSCVANGNSQMYDSKVFLALLPRAGLQVTRLSDGVGRFHTLVECAAAAPEGSVAVTGFADARAPPDAALPAVGPQAPSWEGVWIVIPAYNEARTIRGLAEAALALCPRVVVVDDGSTDATAAAARRAGADACCAIRATRARRRACSTAFRPCARSRRGLRRHPRRRRPARPERCAQPSCRLAPPARARRDRLAAARPLPLPAGTLCGEPLRLLLDLVGRRAPDRRLAVGLSRLSERGDGDRHERSGCAAAASPWRARS